MTHVLEQDDPIVSGELFVNIVADRQCVLIQNFIQTHGLVTAKLEIVLGTELGSIRFGVTIHFDDVSWRQVLRDFEPDVDVKLLKNC